MKNYLPKMKKALLSWGVFGLILLSPGALLSQCYDAGDSPNPPNCSDYNDWETYYNNNCQCSGPFAFQDHDAPTLWIPADVTVEWQNYNYNYKCYNYDSYGNYHYVTCYLPSPDYQVSDCCTDHYDLLDNMYISDCFAWGNCSNNVVATVIRTFVATDNCGNQSTKTQKFTLVDTTAPTIHEYNTYHYLDCDDNVWDVPNPYASDVCDSYVPLVLSNTITYKGDCPYNFDLLRIWSATDDCGNTSTYNQWIYFEDEDGPTISIGSNNSFVECDNIPAAPTGVTAYDDCSGSATVYYNEWINAGPCENEYQIVREWSAHDVCWNETHVTHTINVTDNTDPELATPWDLYIECDDPIPPNTMTATDNCDDNVEIYFDYYYTSYDPCHTILHREWWAYDNCGNYDYEDQYIHIVDVTPPVVFADAEVIVPKGGAVPPHGQATVWDNCTYWEDIIVVESDDVIQNLNCLQSIIERTFTAIDQCGNTSQFVQTIYFTADDFVAPNAYCHNITVSLDANGEVNLSPSDVDGDWYYFYNDQVELDSLWQPSFDDCEIANMTVTPNHFDCGDLGYHTVTLAVIDVAGNLDYCYSYVTIVDDSDPVVVCQNVTLELENGIAFLDFPDAIASEYDNCGIVKFNTTLSQYNFTATGTYSVTVTVYDVNGNSGSCVSTVTVQDAVVGGPINCSQDYFTTIPTGCYASVFGDNVTMYWDAYSNGVACQILGNEVTALNDISILVGDMNDPACPESKSIPLSNLEPSTVYRWKVRCGCQANPLVVSPFTPYAYFQTPGPNPGVNGEDGDGIVKVLDSKVSEINIYPNPNNGEFTLSVDLDNYNVEIFDLAGKLVWGQYGAQDPVLSVELSNLRAGLYQVTVFNAEVILTEKIIIQE